MDWIQLAQDRVQWRALVDGKIILEWILGCEDVDWIQLTQDRVQWRTLVK